MKKLLLIVLAVIASGIIFDACKKGPEDPFLTFRSRKERMTGKWLVNTYLFNTADSLIDNVSPKDTTSPTFGCVGTITYTKHKQYVWEFDKNGLYSMTSTKTWMVDRDWSVQTPECTDSTAYPWTDSITIIKGLWTFGGGVGSYHSKQLLELTDGVDQVTGTSYEIVELREKELKVRKTYTRLTDGVVIREEWTLEPYVAP